jgi:hypothetical protein
VTTWQVRAVEQQLHQIVDLLSEYDELVDRTGNTDLTALGLPGSTGARRGPSRPAAIVGYLASDLG